MKVVVLYEVADTTHTLVIEAYHITTQNWRGGRAIIRTYNKKGKEKMVYHFGKAYLIEKTK